MITLHADELDSEHRAVLRDDRARHIRRVLRSNAGARLRVGVIDGPRGTGLITAVDHHGVALHCALEESPPSRPSLSLLLAMPRPKVMARLWSRLTTLGVDRIVILNSQKVERSYFDSHVLNPDYYEKKIIDGIQQSGCTSCPVVLIRRRFKIFLEDELDTIFANQARLAADPAAEESLGDAISTLPPPADRAVIAVGPEGGWTDYELSALNTAQFKPFALGTRILHSDTAALTAVAIAHAFLDRSQSTI